MRRIAAATVAALAAFNANAEEDWQYYATSQDASVMQFSPSRTKWNSESVVTTWVSETPRTPQPMSSSPGAPKYSKVVSKVDIHCSYERLHYVYSVFYSTNGKVLTSAESLTGPTPIVPGSTGEALSQRVCALPH